MKTRNWLIGGCIALLFSYLLNFAAGRESVYREVNEMFCRESVYWVDSILDFHNIPHSRSYDNIKYKNKKVHKIITVDDTTIISCVFFHPKDYTIFYQKALETSMIMNDGGNLDGYDLDFIDSLFQCALLNVGIDAEVAVELYAKVLAEMFPTESVMNANAPIRHSYKSRELDGGVPTDTVGLGICDQGKLVAKTKVSTSTILARLDWWGTWQTWVIVLLLMAYVAVWGRRKYLKSVKPYINNMYIVGNTCFDFNNHIVVYWNGKCQRMIGNKVQFLKLLVDAAPAYKLLKEDVCKAMWKRNSKDGQHLYAVMVNDVRSNYIAVDDSLELETLLKEGVILHVDETKLKTHSKYHFFMLYLKNSFFFYVNE